MKASELRIGNLISGIYHNNDYNDEEMELETLCKVVTLDTSGMGDYSIYVYSDEDIEQFISFEPIPLTEAWLLKFGFKKWGRDDLPRTISYELNGWSIFPPNSFCDFQEGFGFMWYKPFKDESVESARVIIKYVHQLQNLYVALTGEELQLK